MGEPILKGSYQYQESQFLNGGLKTNRTQYVHASRKIDNKIKNVAL